MLSQELLQNFQNSVKELQDSLEECQNWLNEQNYEPLSVAIHNLLTFIVRTLREMGPHRDVQAVADLELEVNILNIVAHRIIDSMKSGVLEEMFDYVVNSPRYAYDQEGVNELVQRLDDMTIEEQGDYLSTLVREVQRENAIYDMEAAGIDDADMVDPEHVDPEHPPQEEVDGIEAGLAGCRIDAAI